MSSKDLTTYSQMEDSFCRRLFVICKLMIPLTFGIMLDLVILMANLIYVGALHNSFLISFGN